jgi:hypothetical protein
VSYVWEFNQHDADIRHFSTLDLIPKDGFALIVGPSGEWCQCHEYAKQLLQSKNVRLDLFIAEKDFAFTEPHKGEQWATKAGLSDGTGLLVRPDQHILMRIQLGATPEEITKSVLGHLGL